MKAFICAAAIAAAHAYYDQTIEDCKAFAA